MKLETFKSSLAAEEPPAGVDRNLVALWHAARDDWASAHDLVQRLDGPRAAWVHAYLHRKEGDPSNAAHWYRRAGREPQLISLAAEWEKMVSDFLVAPEAASDR